MELTPEQTGWVSGILDGEGSCYIRRQQSKKNPIHSLEVEICLTDYYTVKHIHQLIGFGSFRPVRKKTHNPNHRQAWRISWSSREAEQLLNLLKPYLITKRDEVELALKFLETKNNRVGRKGLSAELVRVREKMYQQMKELKKQEYTITEWEMGLL